MDGALQTDRILIIDFGSQVTQLIARRVRETGIYCEIHPFQHVTIKSIRAFRPKGLILSGGPASVHEIEAPHAPAAASRGAEAGAQGTGGRCCRPRGP